VAKFLDLLHQSGSDAAGVLAFGVPAIMAGRSPQDAGARDDRMNHDAGRARRALRIGNVVAALAVSASLLGLLGAGAGSVPPLGRVLVPGHGAWTWRYLLLPAATRPDAASRPAAPGVSGGSSASGGSRASGLLP
jgi:hypothetical protein